MADISKIKTLDGTTYDLKDNLAYRKGDGIRHKNTSIDQAPQYVKMIENKMTSEEQQTIRAIAGVGDYFYALHLNPNYTVTSNYSGQHGTKGNFAISTLFSPSGSSTVLLDVDEITTKPFVLEIMKNSGVITATDVVNLELFTHTLGQSAARLTDYKVELYTTGSTANTGTFSWQTVYQRSNVSDSPSGLIICLNATSYPYLYFQGVRFTISGATPGSTSSSAWNYNCLDLSLFRLIDQRPAFTAARAIGALDISGGEVYGATTFYHGLSGTLSGSASSATKATQDESGNNIKANYASSISISDHTITLKNKNGVSLGTVTVPDNNTTYSANTSKLVTTTVPNITSVGSAPTLGTAIPADDITAWTTNTPTSFSVSGEKLIITSGTAATLNYTAKSIPNVTSVGSAPTLGTAITVATGSLASNGSGGTVATGITAS